MFVNRALRAVAVVCVAAVPYLLGQGLCAEDVPRFAVEPFWPKPLPDNWILGQVAGAAVGSNDHVWVIHRPLTLLDDGVAPVRITNGRRTNTASLSITMATSGSPATTQPTIRFSSSHPTAISSSRSARQA